MTYIGYIFGAAGTSLAVIQGVSLVTCVLGCRGKSLSPTGETHVFPDQALMGIASVLIPQLR